MQDGISETVSLCLSLSHFMECHFFTDSAVKQQRLRYEPHKLLFSVTSPVTGYVGREILNPAN